MPINFLADVAATVATAEQRRAAEELERRLDAERQARLDALSPAQKHALRVAGRIDRTMRDLPKGGGALIVRRAELERVFADRYGGPDYTLPDDDAGLADAVVMANAIAALPRLSSPAAIERWISARAPWMTAEQREHAAGTAFASPARYTAERLAAELRLTDADRRRLKIKTIAPCDRTPEQRRADRLAAKRQKEAERRRAKGAKPRQVYRAQSLTASRPWEHAGVSRRTWERRRKRVSQVRGQHNLNRACHALATSSAKPLGRIVAASALLMGRARFQATTDRKKTKPQRAAGAHFGHTGPPQADPGGCGGTPPVNRRRLHV